MASISSLSSITVSKLSSIFLRHISLIHNSHAEIIFSSILIIVPASVTVLFADFRFFELENASYEGKFFSILTQILVTNLSSALFLFSGIVTLGFSAFVGCIILGLFLGFSINTAIGTFGFEHVLHETWFYTPFELYGFILAGASGLVVVRYLFISGFRPLITYRCARTQSLVLLGNSIFFLITAAILESLATL